MLEGGAGGSPHGEDLRVRDITEGAAISLTSDGRDGTTEGDIVKCCVQRFDQAAIF
jgi:hypothetical protein